MYQYQLESVHDRLRFADLFPKSDNYMKEAAYLPTVEMDTEPLYEISVEPDILFTPKLIYYRRMLQNDINKHINKVTDMLEDYSSIGMIKYLLKLSQEAVVTLMHEADAYLLQWDRNDELWKKITVGPAHLTDLERKIAEKTTFMHYAFAELTRCLLELQDRYAYANNGEEPYTPFLFYSNTVNRETDKVFEVKQSINYQAESKKVNTVYPYCCFQYNNPEYFNEAMTELTGMLQKFEFIPKDCDVKRMEELFRGRACRHQYIWCGRPAVLTHLVKKLCDEEKSIISPWPVGTSKWEVVKTRIQLEDGKSLDNIRTLKEPKTSLPQINALVGVLEKWK